MSELDRLKAGMEAAETAANVARTRYHAALVAAYRWKVGDVIKSTKGDLAKIYRVVVQYGRPVAFAARQKKDGTFGLRDASMWRKEWQDATLHQSADPAP